MAYPKPIEAKLIIFDMDQTLIDSTKCIINSVNYAREQLGMEKILGERIRPKIGLTLTRLVEIVFKEKKDKAEEAVNLYKQYFKQNCLNECHVYAGAKEMLEELRKKEKFLAVSTTAKLELAVKILKGFKIIDYFDVIIGEEDIQAHHEKPDPESLFLIAEHLKIDPANAVMVGDTYMDVEAGKSAGMKTIAVTYGIDSRKELETVEPDFIIDDINELTKIIL